MRRLGGPAVEQAQRFMRARETPNVGDDEPADPTEGGSEAGQ